MVIASAVGVNQYHFGMWNQYISLPWLEVYQGSEKFAQDAVVQQWQNSPSFFLPFLSLLLPLAGGQVAYLFFGLYLVVLALTLYAFYYLGSQLFRSEKAGLLALVMLAFSFPVIGDVSLWDSLIMERTLVYPLLLLSLAALWQKRYYGAVVLQIVAFAIHPLSATYLIAAACLAVLVSVGFKRSLLGPLALLLLGLSPVFMLKFGLEAPAASPATEAAWMEVMQLRNAHHALPSAYPLALWAKTLGMVLSFFLLVRYSGFDKQRQKFFYAFGAGFVFMGLLGWVFTEIYPVKLILQFQFFRGFLFLTTVTFILWAGLIITRPRPLFYLLALPILSHYFYGESSKTLAALGLIIMLWSLLRFEPKRLRAHWALGGAYLAFGLLALVLRGGFSIDQGKQSAEWYELQDWFAQNTDLDALAIVPPQEAGFRVQSGRNSYGDWYDGTKAFFSESYAAEWKRRMEKLNCLDPERLNESYRALPVERFQQIWQEEASKYSEAYVVQYADRELANLPLRFRNERFVVYALSPQEKGLAQR